MNTKSNIGSFILIIAFGAVVVGMVFFSLSRAKRVLKGWADSNGFEILYSQMRSLSTGPFKWWQTSRGQYIYFVRVRDQAGSERSGWVRCGNLWGGVLLSDETEVKWD